MKDMININPTGIDWESQDIVLNTRAGVLRNYKGEKLTYAAKNEASLKKFKEGLSEHFIECDQGYYINSAEFKVVDDEYLSIRQFFDMRRYCSQVGDYEEAIDKGVRPHLYDIGNRVRGYWRSHEEQEFPKIRQQVRIYKDRTVAAVYEFTWKDGTVDYMVSNVFNGANSGTYLTESDLQETKTESTLKILDVYGFKTVTTDEEIRASAVKTSKKHNLYHYLLAYGGVLYADKAYGNDQGSSYGDGAMTFEKSVRDEINKFFGLFTKENELLKNMFDTKWYCINWGSHRKLEDGITSLTYLSGYLDLNLGAAKAKMTQANYAEELWPTIHWGKDKFSICWERRDNLIICAFKDINSYNAGEKVFVYDIKTKTRKVIAKEKCYRDDTPKLVTKVPTLCNCILNDFSRFNGCGEDWDYHEQKYQKIHYPSETIYGGMSYREVFEGTNVAWIMDNMDALGKDFEICEPEGNYSSRQFMGGRMKLGDEISDKHMGIMSVCVLATTGEALLEQLLKNRQFNMYFAAIWSVGQNSGYFRNVDKKYSDTSFCGIPYHGKEKSLKKMLGMTMQQIQMLNKHIYLPDDEEEYRRDSYHIPNLYKLQEFLGIEGFGTIDPATFGKILGMSSDVRNGNYRGDNIWSDVARYPELMKMIEPLNLKARIEFLDRYGGKDMPEIYNDYLSMRKQLAALQERMPEADIFDENDYPVKVGKAHKFIRYTPGTRDMSCSYWTRIIENEGDFERYIEGRFELTSGTKSTRYVKDGDRLIGAVIDMSALAHINFLHDEMSRWFQLYKDPAEAAAFDKALERVKPLEWEDESGELCVVAPTCPTDVRNEGKVLSHCVASYVDPIIKGTENIMFIRRKDMKGEPFFTVDVSPKGEIRQVHCYHNGNTSAADIAKAYAETRREVYNTKADVVDFMKKWAKAMKGKIDTKTIKSSYGALCAMH